MENYINNISSIQCNNLVLNSSSLPFPLSSNPYGGIPQNILANFVAWTFLIVLFGALRRFAGNYGRLALMRTSAPNIDSPWTQVFYHNDLDLEDADSGGFYSWLISIFTLSDEKIKSRCGFDAVQYLSFQRHLILFTIFITLICVGVILPINFQGNLQGSVADFGHTTISNLRGDDRRLWIHVLLSLLFLPVGIFIMRRFNTTLKTKEDICISSRTIMLAKVPRSFCTEQKISAYFNRHHSNLEIDSIYIAHNVSKLIPLHDKWNRARLARIYCEVHDLDLLVSHGQLGLPSICCTSSEKAYDYYCSKEREYFDQLVRCEAIARSSSIGVAFITFKDFTSAQQIYKVYSNFFKKLKNVRTKFRLENELKPWKWAVRLAPPPDDIYWENLDYDSHRLFIVKVILVNVALFSVLFFFTSPAYILSQLQLFLTTIFDASYFKLPQKINDFVPTLMLWTLSALLPNIVAYSDLLMGHWRRSVENIWIMKKIFFYLLFMVIILPSIGLTSLLAFARLLFYENGNGRDSKLKWNCIFLPDNGAFFVNYVITSALVGTGLELIRFPELFMYAVRMWLAKSVAEISSVRSANLHEFPFGYNYGWMLLIFALTVTYAVVCPLITPFGLFYLLMKYGVDRYNLYYAYKRSKINESIHLLAVNCVIASLLIQQGILLFFDIIRYDNDNNLVILSPRAIFSIIILSICCIIFIINIVYNVLEFPIFCKSIRNVPQTDRCEHVINGEKELKYIPEVLSPNTHTSSMEFTKLDSSSIRNLCNSGSQSYGTIINDENNY